MIFNNWHWFSSLTSNMANTEFIAKILKNFCSKFGSIITTNRLVSVKQENGAIKWLSIVQEGENTFRQVYNLSLSHGIEAIFLASPVLHDEIENLSFS